MNKYHSLLKLHCTIAVLAFLSLAPATNADSDIRHLRIEAHENEASVLLNEELTQDVILNNLQILLDHIRLRQKDNEGLYPPLPEELDISVDTRTIESCVIAKIITETICKLRDDVRRDQALSMLMPLLLAAVSGKIQNISIYHGLELYFLSEFAEGRVYRKESKRIDEIIQAFTEAYHHENIDVREVAESYLVNLAYTLPRNSEQRNQAIKAYANGDETEEARLRFSLDNADSYAPPIISPKEWDDIRSKSTRELLDIYRKNKMDRRLEILIEERLAVDCPENDDIKKDLLNNSFDLYGRLGLLPIAVLEQNSSEEERLRIDEILKIVENEINTTPTGESFAKGANYDIFKILRRMLILNDSMKPLNFHAYGTEKAVSILLKIFERPLTSENEVRNVRKALDVMCEIIKQDVEYKESLCNFISEFAEKLLEQYPQWKNEKWFIENRMPITIPNNDKPLLYYELRHTINICSR